MIIGVAYFAGWHPSDWAVIHSWFHMLDSHVIWGSANSPLGFLGNLWWQPEHTLVFPCKKISVKGFEGAGKTDDI